MNPFLEGSQGSIREDSDIMIHGRLASAFREIYRRKENMSLPLTQIDHPLSEIVADGDITDGSRTGTIRGSRVEPMVQDNQEREVQVNQEMDALKNQLEGIKEELDRERAEKERLKDEAEDNKTRAIAMQAMLDKQKEELEDKISMIEGFKTSSTSSRIDSGRMC